MADIEEKLQNMGLSLPESAPPLFNYIPYVITGSLVFIAGQVPIGGKKNYKGKVGVDVDMQTAQEAAVQCGLNILTHIKDAVNGNWDHVVQCVKLGGFVNCHSDFEDQSLVINSASDLMVAALGEKRGKHARFAVGAPSLPANFSVEIDAIFEINPGT